MPCDTALILGASKGLGQAIAAECRRREWRTIEVARSLPHTGELTDDLAMLRCDLSDAEDVAQFFQRLGRVFPPDQNLLDIAHFFWVAGTWWEGAFADMSREEMLRVIDVNFRNPMVIAQTIWDAITRSARPGHPRTFTVIGSTSGVRPRRNQEVYAATKHAQVGFARSLGESNRNPNAHVSLFVLGGMRTHLFDAKPPANYAEFMDPAKVATHIVRAVAEQRDPYLEQEISRDSALGRSLT